MHQIKRLLTKARDWRRRFQKPTVGGSSITTVHNAEATYLNKEESTAYHAPIKQGQECGSQHAIENRIEYLPPEIRSQILHLLDYGDAKALVHASPYFHAQYCQDRKRFLRKYMSSMLGFAIMDACVAYRSWSIRSEELQTRKDGIKFLKQYKWERLKKKSLELTTTLTEDQSADIIRLHLGVVKPMSQKYTEWAWSNLPVEPRPKIRNRIRPTHSESARLFRAFYRFQICCDLFGFGRTFRRGDFKRPKLGMNSVDILLYFFGLFEPFEGEQIACIHTFAQAQFDIILDDVKSDLSDGNFRASWNLSARGDRPYLLRGTTSAGLGLLHAVLNADGDHKALVRLMRENLCYLADNFLEGGALSTTAQVKARKKFGQPLTQQFRGCMRFFRDRDWDSESVETPQGWTLLWRERYSNIFGDFIPNSLQRWGYVMWDQDVLREPGVKEAMQAQWVQEKGTWDRFDPNRVMQRP